MREVLKPSIKEPIFKDIQKNSKEEKEQTSLFKSELKFKKFKKPKISRTIIPRKAKTSYSKRIIETDINEKFSPKRAILKFDPKYKTLSEKDVIKPKSKKKSHEINTLEKRKIEILGTLETGAEILQKFSKEKEESKDNETPKSNGSGEGQNESVPDIIEEVFGVSDKELSDQDNIKIIIYKDSNTDETIGSFETLCMKIFRECHGSKPPYKLIIKESDYNLEELENWLDGEESITRIDIDNKELMTKLINSENQDTLKQLLARTINKKLGFIIFKTKDNERYSQLQEIFNKWNLSSHNLNIYYLEARNFNKEVKNIVSRLFWSNIKLNEHLSEIMTFDELFNIYCQMEYQQLLKKLESEEQGLFKFSTNKNQGKKSKTHFRIKIFLLKIFAERLKLTLDRENIKENIRTEHMFKNITADVYIKNKDKVYEVETLFGTGRDGNEPMDKVVHTIEKYANIKEIKSIKIILENFTLIRHIKDLLDVKLHLKTWREKYGKNFEFYVLDLEKNSLRSFNDVINEIKTIQNKF